MNTEPPSYFQYSIERQVSRLGLDDNSLRAFRGKRILDIGCGLDANLVEFLRTRGIEAEGIDPVVKADKPYLIRAPIYGLIQNEGAIPRPDNHYDLVLSHGNSTLRVFTDFKDTDMKTFNEMAEDEAHDLEERLAFKRDNARAFNDGCLCGVFMLAEMLRVVHPEGKVVCYPGFTKLSSSGLLINPKGFSMYYQSAGIKEELLDYVEQGRMDVVHSLLKSMDGILASKLYRTVFSATSLNEDLENPEKFLERLNQQIKAYQRRGGRMSREALHTLSQEVLGFDPLAAATFVKFVTTKPNPTVKRDGPKVGRNDQCPCGSGKKFKLCHGK
jgi:hypothetical protein